VAADPPEAVAFDERRLRSVLAQLTRGLIVLHQARKVHRDIKPSNILVTREGRVVLLDFGLVTEAVSRDELNDHESNAHVVGTVAYMSPEQAAAQPVGPETDWYSVGVLLYEALTGRVPFIGTAVQILMDKQVKEPPPPSALTPNVPPDLDRLCRELLSFDPRRRPSGVELLRRLGAQAGPTEVSRVTTVSHQTPFIGRTEEQAQLRAAFERTRPPLSRAVTVFVHGDSGVGKSTLVRRFTEGLLADDPQTVVLSGRCYESESVPYKAFDGVIDALSRFITRLPPADAAALLPARVALLAQVFPVLRRVEVIAQAPRSQSPGTSSSLDPQELRGRVFASLRELLLRLAERRPVVLVIDDFQWADADSITLLRDVMRPPDAPALMLLATVSTSSTEVLTCLDPDRSPERREPTRSGVIAASTSSPTMPFDASALTGPADASLVGESDVTQIYLQSLPKGQAVQLATLLLDRARVDNLSPLTIAKEAGGHPLFIDELVRYMATHTDTLEGRVPSAFRLEEALWSRISGLDLATRELLEVTAVAGSPISQEIASRAAGMTSSDFAKKVALLRISHFVRTTGIRKSDFIEPYHDRIRAAVLGHVTGQMRKSYHRRLALALETSHQADPEALAIHWQGAGEAAAAIHYATLAAQQASSAFAFDRAARLYRLAIELTPVGSSQTQPLRAQLGAALSDAGRGAEAADALLAATDGANAAEALDLQRRAAEQFLRCGRLDDGLAVLSTVLNVAGMKLASSPRAALISLLYRRAQVAIGGLRFKERDPSEVSSKDRTIIDTCWSVALGLSLVDPIQGADFQARHLLLALDAREPYRIARAFAMEVVYCATMGQSMRRRGERLLALGRSLCARLDNPHASGLLQWSEGVMGYLSGQWRTGFEYSSGAEEVFRNQCRGVAWELASARAFSLWSLYYLGRIEEISRRVPVLLKEALDRGDFYDATNLRASHTNVVWLAADQPKEARRHVVESIQQWSPRGFHLQHYFDFHAQGQIDLYCGRWGDALRGVADVWTRFETSLLTRIQGVRIEAWFLRARALLGVAQGASDSRRKELLLAARSDARRIAREGRVSSHGFASMIEAAAASLCGEQERAAQLLRAAIDGFDAEGMQLFSAACRVRLGSLIGGNEGRELEARGLGVISQQGIRAPSRYLQVLAPGYVEP
jgi:hypothetical protein